MVHKLLSCTLLSTLVPLAWSQNITIAFSTDQAGSCDNSQSPSFTTWVIPSAEPYSNACYNVDYTFTNNFPFFGISNSNSTQGNPNPLNGSTLNSNNYNSQTNYSQIWYQQTTQVTRQESDLLASRELAIYMERDCRQTTGQAPHYLQNCRSAENGTCYPLPGRIQSFSISSSAPYFEKHGRKKCVDAEAVGVTGAAANVNAKGAGAVAMGLAVAILSAL